MTRLLQYVSALPASREGGVGGGGVAGGRQQQLGWLAAVISGRHAHDAHQHLIELADAA
jgi:hypothetical protein